uniref:Uncharacterized protein n=1 Tax=Acrobeloides nanus TaxID=290746 RepID=A0A914CR84_9BILA
TSKSAKETKPNKQNAEVKKSPAKDKDKSSGNNKSTPKKCSKKKNSKSNKEESKSPKEKSEVPIEEHKKQSEINPTTAATVPVQSITISGGEIFENAPNDERYKVAKKNQAKSNQESARVIQLPTGKIILRGDLSENRTGQMKIRYTMLQDIQRCLK